MESSANSDDLFNLELVCTATVDVVSHPCEGRDKGSVDSIVVRERDGHLSSPKYFCSNGGTSTSG